MLMKKTRSEFPVAGPRAEKANIRKPDRKRWGVFCLIQAMTPTIIRGITVPKERVLPTASAQAGVVSVLAWRMISPISLTSRCVAFDSYKIAFL